MEPLISVILSSFCLVALFLVVGVLFPSQVGKSKLIWEAMPGRSFLIGFVNTLFVIAIVLGIIALAEATGFEIISIIAVAILIIFVIMVTFGLASVVHKIGPVIVPTQNSTRQVIIGGGFLILACLTPFIGWFGLFPYIGMTGVGALIISIFKGRNIEVPYKKEPGDDN